jgi:hypothetical protein
LPENFNWRESRYVGNAAIIGVGRALCSSGDVKRTTEGSAEPGAGGAGNIVNLDRTGQKR